MTSMGTMGMCQLSIMTLCMILNDVIHTARTCQSVILFSTMNLLVDFACVYGQLMGIMWIMFCIGM